MRWLASLALLLSCASCTVDACRDCTAYTEVTVTAPCLIVNLTEDASVKVCDPPDAR